MKKLLIIGAIALVVVGCVLAAGCTSNTSTPAATTEDFAVGTWTLPNGTTVVFGENFKGVMTTGDKTFNFTWKKTTDGKYQVDREDGAQVIWTLDKNKGIMTNADGNVLTKKLDGTSGVMKLRGMLVGNDNDNENDYQRQIDEAFQNRSTF